MNATILTLDNRLISNAAGAALMREHGLTAPVEIVSDDELRRVQIESLRARIARLEVELMRLEDAVAADG